MKEQVLRIAGVALLAGVGLYAQGTSRLIVDVPFEFTAGTTVLPSGRYTVDLGRAPSIVALQSTDHRSAVMTIGQAAQSQEVNQAAKVVFHRYGRQYFLFQVWTSSSNIGRQLPQTARERELARLTPPSREILLATGK